MNLKPFSTISSEEWYQNLADEEKDKVQNQYLEYKQRYEDFRNQVVTSKNRVPNKVEWDQFNSVTKLPVWHYPQEEEGLKTGELTFDLLGLTPVGKVATTGVAGASLLAANMAMRKGATKLPALAKKEGGWVGVAEKTYDKEKYSLYKDLKSKGLEKQGLWEETGIFDFGAGSRYFDLDVVDDYIKNRGKIIREGYHSLRGTVGSDFPSLLKHVPERDQILYSVKQDKVLKAAGGHDPNIKEVLWNPFQGAPEKIIPHEVQHVIQAVNKLQSRGYNPTDARKLLDSSEELRKQFKLTPETMASADKFISKYGPAYSAYRHNVGEVEATFNQEMHNFIQAQVEQGKSAGEIKKNIKSINPYTYMKSKGYDLDKVWSEDFVKASSMESGKYKDLYEKELKKLNQEPELKVKLTKKEKKKVPERYKDQAL